MRNLNPKPMDQKSNNNSKDKILSRLRGASSPAWSSNWPEKVPGGEVFDKIEDLATAFSDELTSLGGTVFFEKGESSVFEKLKKLKTERNWGDLLVVDSILRDKFLTYGVEFKDLQPHNDDFEAGITRCEALIALTGSIMVCSSGASGRRMNVFPPVHVILAAKSDLVPSINVGFMRIEERYQERPSHISLITGPSRTADIEKTLVMGAHGPKELIVLMDLEG
jgi:L-lactate dehydrogenase complex protein LldG